MGYWTSGAFGALLPVMCFAQTVCPTSADLAGDGILFTTATGESELHRIGPNGMVMQFVNGDGYQARNILAHGVHAIELADIYDGQVDRASAWRFGYDRPLSALPVPEPRRTVTISSRAYFEGEAEVEIVTHTWGAPATLRIDGCTYQAVPVRMDFDGEYYDHVEEMMYLPELGTALLTVYQDEEGRDEFVYVSVSLP